MHKHLRLMFVMPSNGRGGHAPLRRRQPASISYGAHVLFTVFSRRHCLRVSIPRVCDAGMRFAL